MQRIAVYGVSKSAAMIFERHANLKCKFGNGNFRAMGCYASTGGLKAATIQKYIREQDKQDQIEDPSSKKEYKNPFKGSRKSHCCGESRRHAGADCYKVLQADRHSAF